MAASGWRRPRSVPAIAPVLSLSPEWVTARLRPSSNPRGKARVERLLGHPTAAEPLDRLGPAVARRGERGGEGGLTLSFGDPEQVIEEAEKLAE